MKFSKRLAIVCGVLFTALLCMGIVYIDNTKHYFYTAGGLVQMWVNTNFVFGVDTNTGRVGWGVTNTASSFLVQGKQPATNATGNGTSAAASGALNFLAGQGGGTFATTTASGGAGGGMTIRSGQGGDAPLAKTNSTAGNGGTFTLASGIGGGGITGASTNAATGGSGGNFLVNSGVGGSPNAPATNTVGGNGGGFNLTSGSGGSPTAGWAAKGGSGGLIIFQAGSGGASARTNSGNGGAVFIGSGSSGNATLGGNAGTPGQMDFQAGGSGSSTGGGNPSSGADMTFTAGAGNTGATNSNGGTVFLAAGASGGSGAKDGFIALGMTQAGTPIGFVGAGIASPSDWLQSKGNVFPQSNVVFTNITTLLATNTTANTNVTMDFNQAVIDIYPTNNMSFTNIVNLPTNGVKSIIVRVTVPTGPIYNVVFPTLGGDQFGVHIFTNRNSPIFSTATGGLVQVYSLTAFNTNLHLSRTEW